MADLYFENLRLQMGGFSRFLARLIVYSWYASLAALIIVLLFTDFKWMQSLGWFLILFLGDRLIHLNHGEKKIKTMPPKGRVNLDIFLSPSAMSILEKSLERSNFLGGDIKLWIKKQCLTYPEIRKQLKKERIDWKKENDELSLLLKKDRAKIPLKDNLNSLEDLVKVSYKKALDARSDFIEPGHVFNVII